LPNLGKENQQGDEKIYFDYRNHILFEPFGGLQYFCNNCVDTIQTCLRKKPEKKKIGKGANGNYTTHKGKSYALIYELIYELIYDL
jgi:hypothetical protein